MHIVACIKKHPDRDGYYQSHISYQSHRLIDVKRIARRLAIAARRMKQTDIHYTTGFMWKHVTFSPKLVAPGRYKFQPAEFIVIRGRCDATEAKTPPEYAHRLYDAEMVERLGYSTRHLIERYEEKRYQ